MSNFLNPLSAIQVLEGEKEGNATDALAYLIMTGDVWELQGSYLRSAVDAIASGLISEEGKVLRYPEDDGE